MNSDCQFSKISICVPTEFSSVPDVLGRTVQLSSRMAIQQFPNYMPFSHMRDSEYVCAFIKKQLIFATGVSNFPSCDTHRFGSGLW